MSESEWGRGPLFEPPVVRIEAEQQVKVERPPEIEVRQVLAPPRPARSRPRSRRCSTIRGSRQSFGIRSMPAHRPPSSRAKRRPRCS